ncbi:glycosyltransferase [Sphingobium sp. MI1205]|uniref:glycosyltransferase n=1 Tax=Sphingobium sp. MI1205 TaxID=407020 RepID=UPI00077016BE|nr:glycosyltransferase [Sphingobium sp. MI1205]AMK18931.1 putative glycosyl transferase, family 2 [Sphingobium sp. MI1205]
MEGAVDKHGVIDGAEGTSAVIGTGTLVKTSSQHLASAPARPIVVVLGMHRSGTSLLSNVLHYLGVDMADLTDHVSSNNAGGFWERPDLVAIQDEILLAIGRPISQADHALPFPPGWWRRKEVQAIKPRLIAYLSEQLAKSSNLWGFKDPRTCRLLPLWWEVFRDLNLRPIYVHAVRNPAEASVSMSKKSKIRKVSVATSEMMWLSYNYDILRYVTTEQAPILVDYNEWFEDPAAVAVRLVEGLGIGSDLSLNDARECVEAIVKGEFRHQVADGNDLGSAMPVATLLYGAMISDRSARATLAQLPTIDLLFRSIKPVVDQLHANVKEQAELVSKLAAAEQHRAELELSHQQYATSQKKMSEEQAKLLDAIRANESDLNARLDIATAEVTELTAKELRRHCRMRGLLKIARDWRARACEERATATELHRKYESAQSELSSLEGRLAELTESSTIFRRRSAELEDRNSRLINWATEQRRHVEQLKGHINHRAVPDASILLSTLKSDISLSLDGKIDYFDRVGVSGRIRMTDLPNVIPVVEVRVDGEFLFAQSCGPALPNEEGYPFLITWCSIAPKFAGRRGSIEVPGAAQQIGYFDIPNDLVAYHVSPAERAAEIFGGTISEAQDYQRWIAEHETAEDLRLAQDFAARIEHADMFTIWVFGATDVNFSATIRSLTAQLYGNWEAICIGALPYLECLDPRVRCIEAAELPSVLELYGEDALFTFAEAGDLLSRTALLHLAVTVKACPDFSLIYSDEDRIDPVTGVRANPYMKGDWSTDLALVQDYFCRLALMRSSFLKRGNSSIIDLAALYRTALSCALADEPKVIHVPFVLYHRSYENQDHGRNLASAVEEALRAFPDRFARASVAHNAMGNWSIDWALPAPPPRVSLIVPTRDRVDLLRVCVDGFLHQTDYPDLEIIIADNDSVEDETKAYFAEIGKDKRVSIVPCPGPFNYSVINNLAASHASGSILGLMNNDLKVIDRNWLAQMTARIVRPEIGIVGAKLLYGDDTVQHAGVTLGIGLASHIYKGFSTLHHGRHGRLTLSQDVSAVTAACLLVRREVWDEVGGLEETLPVAYNDVDFCLKVSAAGYRVLWAAEILMYHLESQSRGKDISPEKRERLDTDKKRMRERWGERLDKDPFHSPNLSNLCTDASLSYPARVTPSWQETN